MAWFHVNVRRLQELDGHSVEAESNFEILRAQRAAARQGKKTFKAHRVGVCSSGGSSGSGGGGSSSSSGGGGGGRLVVAV